MTNSVWEKLKVQTQAAEGATAYRNSAVDWFAGRMKTELDRNAYKGDWKKCDVYEQIDEIMYHTAKLILAVSADKQDAIAEYSADVANHALIVADLMGVLGKPVKSDPAFLGDVTDVEYKEAKDQIAVATDAWREAVLELCEQQDVVDAEVVD